MSLSLSLFVIEDNAGRKLNKIQNTLSNSESFWLNGYEMLDQLIKEEWLFFFFLRSKQVTVGKE